MKDTVSGFRFLPSFEFGISIIELKAYVSGLGDHVLRLLNIYNRIESAVTLEHILHPEKQKNIYNRIERARSDLVREFLHKTAEYL